MKVYLKELIILSIQMFIFYIYPLLVQPTDTIGMVFIIWISTIISGIIISIISTKKIKYLYPIMIAILFIPTVFIYYNESALIYSLWYFASSSLGILIGNAISVIKS